MLVGWWLKDEHGIKEAYAEVQRPRFGRKARIAGDVDIIMGALENEE